MTRPWETGCTPHVKQWGIKEGIGNESVSWSLGRLAKANDKTATKYCALHRTM